MTQVPTSILGRSGISVSRLGLGGLWLTEEKLTETRDAVSFALEAGLNFIDTAPAYGDSERVLGKVLSESGRPDLVLSTKLGGRPVPFDPKDEAILTRSIEMSLESLGRESIDVLMVHEPDRKQQYDWWSDDLTYEGPVRSLLEQWKSRGLVKAIGVGGTTAHELARICDSGAFDIVLTAYNYSLLWREAALEIFPAAKRHNMGVIAGSPLQGGILAVRRDHQIVDAPWISNARREQILALYALLDEEGLDLAETAMRFVYFSHHVDSTLTGVKSKDEIVRNLKILDLGPLPERIISRLDEVHQLVPFRPTLEPFDLPLGLITEGQPKFR